jgi:hypothetical protein
MFMDANAVRRANGPRCTRLALAQPPLDELDHLTIGTA